MKPENHSESSRRGFLRQAALAAGLASLPPGLQGVTDPAPVAPPAFSPPIGYLSFGSEESAFVEAMVDVMCPADALTPRGVDCGLALFIDRQLAGAFGKGERLYRRGPWRPGRPEDGYQLPITPEEFFKAGLNAANEVCVQQHGKHFADLSAVEADAFLVKISDGQPANDRVSFAEWFNELVYPLFTQACFSDPIYGGNRGKVFWKMLGYPGLPAVNGLNMIKYRGKPFPGALDPKSIEDFS